MVRDLAYNYIGMDRCFCHYNGFTEKLQPLKATTRGVRPSLSACTEQSQFLTSNWAPEKTQRGRNRGGGGGLAPHLRIFQAFAKCNHGVFFIFQTFHIKPKNDDFSQHFQVGLFIFWRNSTTFTAIGLSKVPWHGSCPLCMEGCKLKTMMTITW